MYPEISRLAQEMRGAWPRHTARSWWWLPQEASGAVGAWRHLGRRGKEGPPGKAPLACWDAASYNGGKLNLGRADLEVGLPRHCVLFCICRWRVPICIQASPLTDAVSWEKPAVTLLLF